MRWLFSIIITTLSFCVVSFALAEKIEHLDFEAYVKENNIGEIKTGIVAVGNNVATIDLTGMDYIFLDTEAARFVLEEVWENLPDPTVLGMIVPKNFPNDNDEWGIAINENTDGYISDDDAKDINAQSLLEELKKMNEETNQEKEKRGYENIAYLTDWAIPPSYDANGKKLIWGTKRRWKEDAEASMFNYEIRILGKKGYLQLEGLASLDQADAVKKGSMQILEKINFSEGNMYNDYNWFTDKSAEIGILGLLGVAGAKKAGLLGIIGLFLLKFWKILIVVVSVLGAWIFKIFKKRNNQRENNEEPNTEKEKTL